MTSMPTWSGNRGGLTGGLDGRSGMPEQGRRRGRAGERRGDRLSPRGSQYKQRHGRNDCALDAQPFQGDCSCRGASPVYVQAQWNTLTSATHRPPAHEAPLRPDFPLDRSSCRAL